MTDFLFGIAEYAIGRTGGTRLFVCNGVRKVVVNRDASSLKSHTQTENVNCLVHIL